MEDILAIVLIFGGGTLFALSMSPVGRALADRIRGATGAPERALDELQDSQMALAEEVDALRQEVAEVNERLEFAERLLAAGRQADALQGGGEAES